MAKPSFVDSTVTNRRRNILIAAIDESDRKSRECIRTLIDANVVSAYPADAFSRIGEKDCKYDVLVIEPLGMSLFMDPQSQQANLDRIGVIFAVKRALAKGLQVIMMSATDGDLTRYGYTPEEAEFLEQYRKPFDLSKLIDSLESGTQQAVSP